MQWRRLTPRGNTPYNDLYEEAPAEMGTFLRLKVYERVRISLVGVYERVEKSVTGQVETWEDGGVSMG